MKKLPLTIQTFSEIRDKTKNYVYIDKTPYIYKMITGTKANFFARPRRFGKSMTLSTIMSIYLGEKEHFEGLWIEDKWDWSKKHPIIYITFNNMAYNDLGVPADLMILLKDTAKKYGIVLEKDSYVLAFKELIEKMHETHGKVVVLIDEYDKPINDYLEKGQLHIAEQNREHLRSFYGVIKADRKSVV